MPRMLKMRPAKNEIVMNEVNALQKQLDRSKVKVGPLEEALAKEKSTSTLREMNKLREVRKEHFAQLSEAIIGLEAKFGSDLKEMPVWRRIKRHML